MAKPEYWDSNQTAKYLKIELNNLRQITHRHTRDHNAMGHKNDRCYHLIVDHTGMGKSWYKAEKVINYGLFRKGEISPVNAIVRQQRDQARRFR